MAGDALLAMSLAGSLFFKVDPAAGREKVLLGLLLTMAPFAVVGPLIGPLLDRFRGGHRAVIVALGGAAGRRGRHHGLGQRVGAASCCSPRRS